MHSLPVRSKQKQGGEGGKGGKGGKGGAGRHRGKGGCYVITFLCVILRFIIISSCLCIYIICYISS